MQRVGSQLRRNWRNQRNQAKLSEGNATSATSATSATKWSVVVIPSCTHLLISAPVHLSEGSAASATSATSATTSAHPLICSKTLRNENEYETFTFSQKSQKKPQKTIHLYFTLWRILLKFLFLLTKIPEETSENYSFIFDSLENSFKISLSPHKR